MPRSQRRARYGRFTGGPDPLAPPLDLAHHREDLRDVRRHVVVRRRHDPGVQTRAECVEGPRPCPYVSCKYHLYLDVQHRTGAIKLNFPDIEVEQNFDVSNYWDDVRYPNVDADSYRLDWVAGAGSGLARRHNMVGIKRPSDPAQVTP